MRTAALLVLAAGGLALPARAQAPASGPLELRAVTAPELLADLARAETPVVLNVWATWCGPCIAEFPYFTELAAESDTLAVRFLSVDFEEGEARAFLEAQGVSGISYFKSGTDGDFIGVMHPEWSGAVPATFIYGADGTLLAHWAGEVTRNELYERVRLALQPTTDR